MWRMLRNRGQFSDRVQFISNSIKIEQKIFQCSISSFHTNLERKNSNKSSPQSLRFNKLLNQCQFSGRMNSSGLLKSKRINFACQPARHFSDLPDIFEPPVPRFEGIIKILVDSPPIEFIQNHLIMLHSSLGLPWWATIVLVTCTARTLLTLPSALYQQHIFAKSANLKWEMDDIVHDLKREANYRVQVLGYSEKESRVMYNKAFREKWNELVVRDNCHPMKGFVLFLTQLPMWICLSAAIRNLCYVLPYSTPLAQRTLVELSNEGFGWISNLAAADPYYILPITLGICNLINIEFNYMLRVREPSTFQRIGLNVLRGISLILVPIAAIVPSGMSLYWTTSSVFGIVQNVLIVSPRVRRALRIEETEHELQHPYKHVLSRLKQRIPGKLVETPEIKIPTAIPRKLSSSIKKK